MFDHPRYRVSYDANGNIILSIVGDSAMESVEDLAATPSRMIQEPVTGRTEEDTVWTITEPGHAPKAPKERKMYLHLSGIAQLTRSAMQEGIEQYVASIEAAGPVMDELRSDSRTLVERLKAFLAQPVWIPNRRKELKQYSRGTLFLIDVGRFGATFAGIFLVLFTALNYQSFWEISSAQVNRILQGPSVDAKSDTGNVSASLLQNIANDDGRNRGELLSFLPPVGPPDNRLVVPKLGLNVPLVNPPVDGLLRQDWTQVETDIQNALQQGVVHYPGTANPGQAGNFFVTGHSSYYPWDPGQYKTVFARLHELNVGDEYWAYYGGDKHRYIIRSKREVSPSDVTVLDQPGDARISTLMTCTPVGTALRRLVIRAEEVDPVSGETLAVGEHVKAPPSQSLQLEALPI